jgi:hypothetical protein
LAAPYGEGRSGPAGQDLEGALLVDPLLFEQDFGSLGWRWRFAA